MRKSDKVEIWTMHEQIAEENQTKIFDAKPYKVLTSEKSITTQKTNEVKFNFERYVKVKPETLLRKSPLRESASWIVVHKETGDAVLETFVLKIAQAINQDKYEVIPTKEYLYALNAKIKEQEKASGKTEGENK